MNETRENLLTRIINIYGFEHNVTVSFAKMCEDNKVTDEELEEIVKRHEKCPQIEEDDE